MFVEDRTSYNGPVQVTVKPSFTVAELKEHVQCEFEIPIGVQKWILGKSLAEDDQSTLSSHGISKSGQSIFLYLVAPKEEENIEAQAAKMGSNDEASSKNQEQTRNPVPNGEHRKGSYWNYEEDRWSYCSDDDDDDDDNGEKVETKTVAKPATSDAKEVVKADNGAEDVESDPESEWEYFYEDAELKEPEKEQNEEAAAGATAVKNPPGKTQKVDPRDGWVCRFLSV